MEALIAQEPLLQEYRYYLQCIQEDDRYLLNGDVEEALAKYGMSGGDAWADLQAYLTSSVKADYQGKPLTLSAVRNLAYDADPEVRKQAYEAELACYEKIKDAVAFSLNSIKMQAISECELRGFASPLEKTLHESLPCAERRWTHCWKQCRNTCLNFGNTCGQRAEHWGMPMDCRGMICLHPWAAMERNIP